MQEEIKIREIIQSYALRIKNLQERYDLIIEGKDKLIEKYESEIEFYRVLIEQLSNRSFVIENKIQNRIDHSRKIDISGKTINASGAGLFNLGDISGTVANTINQLPASSDLDNPGIKELLNQLKKAIEKATELDEADKYDALEEVQHLAQASLYDDLDARQAKAEKSLRMLGRIFTGLPTNEALMNICKEVLPAIAKLF